MTLHEFFKNIALGEESRVQRALEEHPQWACLAVREPGDPDTGRSALLIAAQGGHLGVIRQLLQHCDDAALDIGIGEWGTPLIAAATAGHTDCVDLLAKNSAPSGRDSAGFTALMWAARGGHAASAQIILREHGKIEAGKVSQRGFTALLSAAQGGTIDCFDLLLPESDVRATTSAGETALMLAVESGSPLVSRLIELCDSNAIDLSGRTALMIAATTGNAKAIQSLLPVVPWGTRNGRETALSLAARRGHEDCVKMLLAAAPPKELARAASYACECATKQSQFACAELIAPHLSIPQAIALTKQFPPFFTEVRRQLPARIERAALEKELLAPLSLTPGLSLPPGRPEAVQGSDSNPDLKIGTPPLSTKTRRL